MAKHDDFIDHTLLVEIFGFLPSELIDELYDAMNLCLYNITQGFIVRFTSLCPEKEAEIKEAIRSFELRTELELDRTFNTFQEYMFKNIFRIPEKLDIKPAYLEDIQTNLTPDHEKILDLQLTQIREELVIQLKLQHYLNNAIRDLQVKSDQLDDCIDVVSFLSDAPKKHKVEDPVYSLECLKINLDTLKKSILTTIPELQTKLKTMEPEQRTLELRSALRTHINSTLGQLKK
ncbi:hypothetical protein INT47_002448 [Mucor saturninus]|uniref:Protein MIS12 homolog n=1 Tax=Mucor saturninus TaxID=64648 RepID=A0A8H7RG22_9FUNG|nr:hypothetical protein INT47_002448 [Mucor saturninus]